MHARTHRQITSRKFVVQTRHTGDKVVPLPLAAGAPRRLWGCRPRVCVRFREAAPAARRGYRRSSRSSRAANPTPRTSPSRSSRTANLNPITSPNRSSSSCANRATTQPAATPRGTARAARCVAGSRALQLQPLDGRGLDAARLLLPAEVASAGVSGTKRGESRVWCFEALANRLVMRRGPEPPDWPISRLPASR